jgi:hypothetical protein
MPASAKPPIRNALAGRSRARHVFARLMEGQSTREIAAAEGLSPRRIQQIVRNELKRREANPADDSVLMQVARLERALDLLGAQIDAGRATAALAFVRVIEMLSKLAAGPLHLAGPDFRQLGAVAALTERLQRLDAAREVVAARASVVEAKPGEAQTVEKTATGENGDFANGQDR